MISTWEHFAGHAATVLDRLAACDPSVRLAAHGSLQRGWDELQLSPDRRDELRNALIQLKCSDVVVSHLVEHYVSDALALADACRGLFQSTLEQLAHLAYDPDALRSHEAATRGRFGMEFTEKMGELYVTIIDGVREARRRAVASIGSTVFSPTFTSTSDERSPFAIVDHNATAGEFTPGVLRILDQAFKNYEHVTKGERAALAKRTGLSEKQIGTWFANQRQRRKNDPGQGSCRSGNPAEPEPIARVSRHSSSSSIDSTTGLQLDATNIHPPPSSLVGTAAVDHTTTPRTAGATIPLLIPQRTGLDMSLLEYHPAGSTSDHSSSSYSSSGFDSPENYYGLPFLPARSQPTFELPFVLSVPDSTLLHEYSTSSSMWNNLDSSDFSPSFLELSGNEIYGDNSSQFDFATVQLEVGGGLLTATQATFSEASSSSVGSLSSDEMELEAPLVSMDYYESAEMDRSWNGGNLLMRMPTMQSGVDIAHA